MSEAMLLEVIFYGAALLWLLTVVPAGVACCLRRQWMYFWFGWLTLGILWYIGALGRKPDQPAHEPRLVAGVLAVTAAAFLVLGFFGARPSAVLGVDGSSLQHSVGNSFLFGSDSACERSGRTWTCFRWDGDYSSDVPYRVNVNGMGCWQAVKKRYAGERGPPERVSGCITLYDVFIR